MSAIAYEFHNARVNILGQMQWNSLSLFVGTYLFFFKNVFLILKMIEIMRDLVNE